ncbi:MAG: biosynthetic-type acetolactate synthase large subunit [Alphaproteobacteria bacterium]|nr:biosynthetic-type acetolactate synthase large subunit [Alphaproteobacteria bacterium]
MTPPKAAMKKQPDATPAEQILGAEIIVKSLINEEVDTVFGYPGGAVLPIYDALFKQNQLRHILVRHEQAATHAAEGYARSTGKVGVVLVTSGPGATNAVTGLTDAMLDSIPLVCITGQVPTHLIGSDAFQEADTTGITRSCTKYNYLVRSIEDLPRIMHEAFHVARTGRPGPVVIDIPKNIMNQLGSYAGKPEASRPSYNPQQQGDAAQVEKAVALMAAAKRPIFYVGGGVINAGLEACAKLTELVHATGFPITNTLMGLGAFPGNDPQFVGMLGMHGSLEANMCMAECDVMINIGARFDDRVTGKLDKFSVDSIKIHVDIDPSSINKNIHAHVPIIGDAGVVIEQMLELWKAKYKKPDTSDWWKKIEGWRARKSFSYKQGKDIIKPQYALDRLNALSKKHSTFITTDVGQHQMWAAQFLTFDKPYRWMTSGGLGTMGYGLPSAMGVQIAHPDDLVVCVTGEASFMMNIQELSTIAQYRLPVKILILNNHCMGMVRQWQQMFHGCRYSESYMDSLPDFVKLAEAYGIKGMQCSKVEDVDKALSAMIDHKGPVLLDMIVDPEENVYPMIPAGAAHYELVLGAEENKGDIKTGDLL